MPDTTANLGLPFILPAQAQKHVTHNEALQRLDVLVQAVVWDWTKHGGHAARFLSVTVSRPSRTAALVTATR